MTSPSRFALTLALASAAIAVLIIALLSGPTSASAADPSLAIDAGISGNTATSIGTIENCVAVKTNDQFQMDLVIQNISDLLAWEVYINFDPTVVEVIDQNVKLFQQANAGSAVLDVSTRVPDDSGSHDLAAFDSSDPPTPDSGTGVLARITFKALGAGATKISFGSHADSTGKFDRGTLLRDISANPIGDTNGDGYFDGDQETAQVAVDGSCPAGAIVATSPTNATGGSDSSFPWAIVGGAGGLVAVIVAAGVVVLFSRRQRARRTAPDA